MRLLVAAGLAGLAVLPALATAGPGEEVPVRDCGSRGDPGDGAPVRFAGARDVIVGPVSFAGLQHYATRRRLGPPQEDGGWWLKSGAKVLWGPPPTLRVAKPGGPLALEYARDGRTTSAVRFEPCPPGTPMFVSGRLRRVTVFPGGFSLARPGCYELVVQSGARVYRRTVSFGAGRCA
jgi:hypothetical protein